MNRQLRRRLSVFLFIVGIFLLFCGILMAFSMGGAMVPVLVGVSILVNSAAVTVLRQKDK